MDTKQRIARIEARNAERDGLLRELRLGTELLDMGIVRHGGSPAAYPEITPNPPRLRSGVFPELPSMVPGGSGYT